MANCDTRERGVELSIGQKGKDFLTALALFEALLYW